MFAVILSASVCERCRLRDVVGLPSASSLDTRAGVPTAMDTLVLARYLTCSSSLKCLAKSCP